MGIGALALGLVALLILQSGRGEAVIGPQGPFAQALYSAFPEADLQRIETVEADDLPIAATIHLPAHLIEPSHGFGDPFYRLGAQFGGTERTLSGVELAERMSRLSAAVLPEDMPRCHTYKVGAISSDPEAPRRTRALHIHLHPGC